MQRLWKTIWLLGVLWRWGAVSATTMPRTLGPFIAAMLNTQLIDYAHNAPFAPTDNVPRVLGVSIFYPTATNNTIATPYWPPENAADESEEEIAFGVNITRKGLVSLTIPLSLPETNIAAPPVNSSSWPVLLFSPAFGDTRFLYPSLLRQISSHGFVVIAFDTAYDTNVFVLTNGTVLQGNSSLGSSNSLLEAATTSTEARGQDATFILDHVHDNITSLIPGCNDTCLNTTNVAMFGHSIGGAATAAAMLADTRIIGGLNYDGALLGPVVKAGFTHRPFAIFGTQNQSSHSTGPLTTLTNWTTVWPRILEAPKWWLLLNDSRHYTFSDLPLIVQRLGVEPNETSMLAAQITGADAVRTEKVLVAYTVAFFKSVFSGKVQKLLKGPSKKWPEVTFDTFDLNEKRKKGGNGSAAAHPYYNSASVSVESSKAVAVGQAIAAIFLMLCISGYM